MKVVVLTGAGISAESGLKTFRDSNGLWEGHNVMEVASLEGFHKNPALVLDFYNQRRRQLLEVHPNEAHKALASLQENYEVVIITQNVDDLHERAGSKNVIHLHGELLKAKSTFNEENIIPWEKDIVVGNLCKKGYQMRPHIVWFGEAVPLMENAIKLVNSCDALMVVGTSMQVYPAASLIKYMHPNTPLFFIDPKPSISESRNTYVFSEKATAGVPKAIEILKNNVQ